MTTDALDTPAPAGERALASWIARVWNAAKRLYLFLLPLRFSFLALLLVAFALVVSAQGYDIIAHLAEDDPTGAERSNDGQRAGYVVGVIFLALEVWYWSRQLLHVKPAPGRPHASEFPWLTAWLPRILGALAFVIAMAALWRVARNYGVPEPVRELRKLAIILGIALIAFLVFTILRRRQLGFEPTAELSLRERPLGAKIFMGVSVLLAIVLFVWATFFVQSTVYLGSAAIVLLAFALSVPVGSTLVWLGTSGGVPTFTFLLIWALIISPLADNHVVRTLHDDNVQTLQGGNVHTRPPIGATFDQWFERLDREHPSPDGSHPVFLVSAEGGGIRAAYWAAAVLTSLTDTVPTFADHTFALSGVSGGALGSAVYDALLVRRNEIQVYVDDDDTPEFREHQSLRFAARQMLSEDALAPTLAAMTQPDLAQRFVPAPIFPDRELALEGALQRAWSKSVKLRNGKPDETFSNGFLAMMDGKSDRFPSMFLNGTIVETGQRIIASNLQTEGMAKTVDLFGAIGDDVRVTTAVGNSTRFTYVSPAGTLRRAKNTNGGSTLTCAPGARCEHVVDGGYFENSGSATLSDVLDVMARSKYASRIRPHVIFIQFRMGTPAPVYTTKYANEVLSPIRALLAVRGGHADLAVEELMEQVGPASYTQFQLVQTKAVFPLGWLLADRTRNLMDQQMGPNSTENGANVRRIAALLKQPVGRDHVQELAAKGERMPKFKD